MAGDPESFGGFRAVKPDDSPRFKLKMMKYQAIPSAVARGECNRYYRALKRTARSLLSILPFERLAVYGFSMDYPTSCKVEFNPKSDRNQGDIAFKSSDGYKIFLSWGEMKKVEKFRDADAHADYSLDRIRGSREAKILDVKRERRRANGHLASFNHVKLDLIKRGIFFNQTKTPQEVRSLHLHCENTSRYFVIYGPATPPQSEKQGEVITKMIQSFICHN